MNAFSSEPEIIKDFLTDEERHLLKLRKRLISTVNAKNVVFDFEQHSGSSNLGLIQFIRKCGYDPKDFIREYVNRIQPFMIIPDEKRSIKEDSFLCVIDFAYRIPLWVEVVYKQNREQVILFHEMNWYTSRYRNISGKRIVYLAMPVDSSMYSIGDRGVFDISVQKGFMQLKFRLTGEKVSDDCVHINAEDYERVLLDTCNQLIDAVGDKYGVELRHIERSRAMTFTSYGENILHNLSLLLDLYVETRSKEVSSLISVNLTEIAGLSEETEIVDEFIRKYKMCSKIDFSFLLK